MAHVSIHPRFSFLIPTYNREALVRLTLDSVLAQTFTDYEVIVIDDGSTDRTLELLQSYGTRIKLLEQVNSGPEAARHRGAAIATGEYLVLLDSDDLLFPHALATYDRVIRELADPPLIFGSVLLVHGLGGLPDSSTANESVEYLPFRDYLSRDVPVSLTSSQLVIKRTVAMAAGALRPRQTAFPFDTADIVLLVGTSSPFILLRRPYTVGYRQHETNIVKRINLMLETAPCLARYEKNGDYPGQATRRFDRYASIGTMLVYWTVKGLKYRHYRLAGKILREAWLMMLAGVLKRLLRNFQHPVPLHRLPLASGVLPRDSALG